MNYSKNDQQEIYIRNFLKLVQNTQTYISAQNLSEVSFTLKPDGSPVSDLDLKIENFVSSQVVMLLPEIQLIGEESEFPLEWHGSYLVIDPIDGTENFVSGIPIWGVGLALILNNQLVASWVHFPELSINVYSHLLKDFLDSLPKTLREPIGVTRVRGFSSNSDWNQEFSNLFGEIRVFGCSLFNILLAAHGAMRYKSSENGVRIWDILPAALIALENGKVVLVNGKDYRGEFLDPNFRYVVEIKTN
jgi:myo-inositol-1(or 4)-monophosphatase